MEPRIVVDVQGCYIREWSGLNFGDSFNGKTKQAYFLCPKSKMPCDFINFIDSKKHLVLVPGENAKVKFKNPKKSKILSKNGIVKFFNCTFITKEERLVICPNFSCECPVIRFDSKEKNKKLFHESCKYISFQLKISLKRYLNYIVK